MSSPFLDRRLTKMVLLALLLAIPVGAVSGCRTASIYNVSNARLAPPAGTSPSVDDVGRAIRAAGERLGWSMQDVRPGEMSGTLTVNRRHVAVVAITYDTSTFSITYQDSKLLMKDGTVIHKSYNEWIRRLEAAIQEEVARASLPK